MYLSKYFYSASFQNDMVGVYTGNIAMGDPLTIVLEESIKNEISEKKKTLDEKLQDILQDYDFNKMSTYEKSKTIFDIVCDSLEYDYEISEYITFTSPNEKYDNLSEEEHDALSKIWAKRENAYDVLITGKAICSGYSKLFALLSRAVGLETLYVDGLVYADASFEGEGLGHAWNYVKMDDGKWYLVDTTYGDNTSPEEKYLWLHKIGEDNREMYDYIMLPEDFEMGFDDNLSGQH